MPLKLRLDLMHRWSDPHLFRFENIVTGTTILTSSDLLHSPTKKSSRQGTADMPTSIAPLIPAGKIRCSITGKLRPNKLEEHVRQSLARNQAEGCGDDRTYIEVEFRIKIESAAGGITHRRR